MYNNQQKRNNKMPKKEHLYFIAVILIGFLDWLTTITGILFYGATEVNPLLSGLSQSSLLLFSVVKFAGIVSAGFFFSKAVALSRPMAADWRFTGRFLDGGYSLTLLMLTAVVINNVIAIAGA
jgi:hypothetical protein